MITEESAFLAAMAESPDDDTLRLIFTDWLEENGQSHRAEFVRVQIAMERLEEGDPQRQRLAIRERELLAQYRRQWLHDVPEFQSVSWVFRRGMPGGIVVNNLGVFFVEAEKIFASFPVTALTIPSWYSSSAERYASMMRADAGLEQLAAEAPGRLVQSDFLRNIEELTLTAVVNDNVLRVLSRSPNLTHLRQLDLGNDVHLTSPGLRQLLESKNLARLESLKIQRCFVEDLSNVWSRHLRAGSTLKQLCLSHCQFDRGLGEFPRCSALQSLHRLELIDERLDETSAQALARSKYLKNLRILRLGQNMLDDAGSGRIFTSASFQNLRVLDLSINRIGPLGLASLGPDQMRKLTELDLSINPLGDEGIASLAKWPGLKNVRYLNLRCTHFTARGASALADSPYLGNVEWLNLGNNQFGDEGLRALLESKSLTSLRSLKVPNNAIEMRGIDLLAYPKYAGLEALDLWGNQISKSTVRRLTEHFGTRLTFEW